MPRARKLATMAVGLALTLALFAPSAVARGVRACLGFDPASAPREPAIESSPELPPAGRLASRRREVATAIVAELARGVATQVARQQPLLVAAMLTMVSSYA